MMRIPKVLIQLMIGLAILLWLLQLADATNVLTSISMVDPLYLAVATIAFLFLGASMLSAPWFSWSRSALSNLGYALKRETAVTFNFGLAISGLTVAIYSVTSLMDRARFSAIFLSATSFTLQLIAVFDEIYGQIHMAVSTVFFTPLLISTLIYAIEKRSRLAGASFMIGLSAWRLYWTEAYKAGVAAPEMISSSAAALWIIKSAIEKDLSLRYLCLEMFMDTKTFL
ncbi:hypothetical protein DRO35_05795 [Candidatus Bathyarchaeota archaeon]|nr:MAG: hypothetical protein DRO35_05795 [Candidatus Bathyarchaeota archaeon]